MTFISKENLAVLKTRAIALCWHAGTMVLVIALDFMAANINLFNLPDIFTVVIGLVLAQVTKALNTPKA